MTTTLRPRALLAGAAVLLAALTMILAMPSMAQQASSQRIVIVLDGSGSMWGQIEGVAKIEIARDVLGEIIPSLPADAEAGLMSYGHREKGQCDDIEVLVEPAQGTGQAMLDAIAGISPKGKTPLSDAVRAAAESLRYTEDRATVVLVTDGIETCEADPCALGRELEQLGVDFTTHVVGFDLTGEEGQQVACLAENTGGLYLAADDADALNDALTQVVAEAPEPEPAPEPELEPETPEFNLVATAYLAEGGPALTDADDARWWVFTADEEGGRAEEVLTGYPTVLEQSLDPGEYVVVVRLGTVEVEQYVEVTATEIARLELVLNAGKLILNAVREEGGEPTKDVRWDVKSSAGGPEATNYGIGMKFVMAAGDLTVRARIGTADVTETIPLAAGETIEATIVVATGRIQPHAYFAEGGPLVERDVRFDVYGAEADITGRREDFGTNYNEGVSFDVPPGDYVVRARAGEADAEVPVTVEANRLAEPDIVLNAGVLAITAPQGDRLDILGAEPDITGRRAGIATNYGTEWAIVLPEGDYVVKVRQQDGSEVEGEATVTAGQRTEITVGG